MSHLRRIWRGGRCDRPRLPPGPPSPPRDPLFRVPRFARGRWGGAHVLDAPNPDIAAEWQNVSAAATWTGLEEHERDPLLDALGARPSSHPRVRAAVAMADLEGCIAQVTPGDQAPSAVLVARYRLFNHSCRVVVGGPVLPTATQAAGAEEGALATADHARRLAERALLAAANPEKGLEVQLKHVIAQATDEVYGHAARPITGPAVLCW